MGHFFTFLYMCTSLLVLLEVLFEVISELFVCVYFRFVGAFCGFSYAIALPCLVYMKIRHQAGTLTLPLIIFHSFLILIGLANFIGQFLLLG